MFFIGIFGIEEKEKRICFLDNLNCKSCDEKGNMILIKRYNYFHIFFIPIIKWNEEYYVICEKCNKLYKIKKDKGKSIEMGEKNLLTYWDLEDVSSDYLNHNQYEYKVCSLCNKEVEHKFKYCLYCGNKLN